MKKIYTLGLLLFASSIFAQETISFEESEGYTLGNIQNQNGWEVTESSDGIITNQIITDEQAKDGSYSFKNGHQDEYDAQWFPIFGVNKTFETPYDYKTFSISYDIFVTQKFGADFEFTAYAIDTEYDEYTPVIGLGVENRGEYYYIRNANYQSQYIDGATWEPNTWNNVKIEINEEEVSYYLNNELVATSTIFSQLPIVGVNFLHNNYGGDAYYDNIKINETDLSIGDVSTSQIDVYPNPVENDFTINLPQNEKIKSVEVYNVSGQKLLESTTAKTSVQLLSKGVYIVKIATENGKSYSKKIIKK